MHQQVEEEQTIIIELKEKMSELTNIEKHVRQQQISGGMIQQIGGSMIQ